jgi:hypothetical protein
MIPLPAWAENVSRKQFVAEDLITAMKLAYPKLEADPQAIVIGLTDADMYISQVSWNYGFSFREEERFAVISSAHLSESESEDNKPVGADVLQKRLTKVFIRDIGILHYRLQPRHDYSSILSRNIDDATDLDDIGDDYLLAAAGECQRDVSGVCCTGGDSSPRAFVGTTARARRSCSGSRFRRVSSFIG